MARVNSVRRIGPVQLALIVVMFVFGLYVDVAYDLPGQIAVSVMTWTLLLYLLELCPREERRLLFI